MALRTLALCDELTRAGEVFPVLFTNRVDGMSYVRSISARACGALRHRGQSLQRVMEREDYGLSVEVAELSKEDNLHACAGGAGHRGGVRGAAR
jgi:hypothetical protein